MAVALKGTAVLMTITASEIALACELDKSRVPLESIRSTGRTPVIHSFPFYFFHFCIINFALYTAVAGEILELHHLSCNLEYTMEA